MSKPTAEPLRLFVRGFLRDHLGLSQIMADAASAVFIKRWLARDTTTEQRYQREDAHTLAAAFDRRVLADSQPQLTDREKAMIEKQLRKEPPPAGLTFPDRAVFPDVVLVFDDSALAKMSGRPETRHTPGFKPQPGPQAEMWNSTAHVNRGDGPRDGGVPGIRPDPTARNYSAGR